MCVVNDAKMKRISRPADNVNTIGYSHHSRTDMLQRDRLESQSWLLSVYQSLKARAKKT